MDKLDLILEKIESMEQRMGSMEQKMGSMEQKMGSMEQKMNTMQVDINQMKESIEKLNVRMDEEVCYGLRIVADGHADLERKINQALLDSKTKEHLHVKMLCIETEVHQIKRNCPLCA